MEKKNLLQDIDNYLLGNTVNNSLFNLFNDIKTYLAGDSIPVELPVSPKVLTEEEQNNYENAMHNLVIKGNNKCGITR